MTIKKVIAGIIAAISILSGCIPAKKADRCEIEFDEALGVFIVSSKTERTAAAAAALYREDILAGVQVYESIRVNSQGYRIHIDSRGTDYASADAVRLYVWNPAEGMRTAEICELSLTSPDILTVRDGYLTDKNGNTVTLRGVNFGGWLLQETWMCPVIQQRQKTYTAEDGRTYDIDWAALDTLNLLEETLGAERAGELIGQYQDNYITEWDFENVKKLGFNCIRIPFWYRNFMSDENGTYICENNDENPGFQALDRAVETAGKYGLYVILDMHGCPGGQNGDHSSGMAGRNYLYKETKYQDIMEDLWVKIADRYKFSKTVAAYDIMNEPMNNSDKKHGVLPQYRYTAGSEAANNAVNAVYDRMIRAVRSVDPYHVITVEGIWQVSCLPSDPEKIGWTNIMYQLHTYDSDESTLKRHFDALKSARENYYTAVYVGEFNPAVYYSRTVELLNKYEINYTMWNYKSAAAYSNDYTGWSLYGRAYPEPEMERIFNEAQLGIWHEPSAYTAAEWAEYYKVWWDAGRLATKSFTLNNTLRKYMAQ